MTAGSLRAAAARRRSGRGARQRRSLAQHLSAARRACARVGLIVLAALLLSLQLRLWAGDGGVRELWRLSQQIDEQTRENAVLRERNEALEAEVLDLKEGAAAVEERARRELSMIRRDETFFQSVER